MFPQLIARIRGLEKLSVEARRVKEFPVLYAVQSSLDLIASDVNPSHNLSLYFFTIRLNKVWEYSK